MNPKYPDIKIQLTGKDSNTMVLLSVCIRAMKKAKLPETEQTAFADEALADDYNHFLRTCMKWFNVS